MATTKKVRRIRKRIPLYKQGIFYVMILFLALTTLFAYQVYKLQVLPFKYMLLFVALLILLIYWMIRLQSRRKRTRAKRSFGRIMLLILCVVFSCGNWYLYKTRNTLSSLTDHNIEVTEISVVVLKDNPAQEMVDLTYTNTGFANVGDTQSQENVLKKMKKDMNDRIYEYSYDSYQELLDAFFDKSIHSIIINESSRSTLNKIVPDFNKKTRVIKTYTYEKKIKETSSKVDLVSKPFNIYITGMDTKGSINTISHSDVNMIVSVNPNTHQILITGIPRDYYIPQTCQGNQADKLTHSGVFGVDCTISSVENYLGLDLDYYAKVNFSTFVDIIDALGGIDVDNPIEFSRKQYHYKKGKIHLDGDAALQYARERKSLEGGDRARSRNQMRVIEGVIRKAMSPSIITQYTDILSTVSGMLQTNMTQEEMTTFIRSQLDNLSKWDIKHIQITGTDSMTYSPANGFDSWVMIPYQPSVDNAKAIIEKFHNDELVTKEDVEEQNEIVRTAH